MADTFTFKKAIRTDRETLEKNEIDASIFKITPKGVFIPENKKQIVDFVREVIEIKKKQDQDTATTNTSSKKQNKETVSISSRAAGTCMSGGSLSDGYVISFTEHINKIISLDVKSETKHTITVEPGMFYRDMEKETLKHGLILPSYPASRELCAVGGMVGNNGAGEKTIKYGKTEKYVEEIEMICADGNVYTFKNFTGKALDNILQNDQTFFGDIHRALYKIVTENENEIEQNRPTVSKNSSGYYVWNIYDKTTHSMNLAKIICGAQGTFGVMTQFKLSLIPVATKSQMAVVFLDNIHDMPSVVNKIKPLSPESFEVFDDHTFKIAMKFLPQIIHRIGGDLFSLAKLFWPEFKMILTGSIPKIVMLIEFVEKTEDDLAQKMTELEKVFTELEKSKNKIGTVKTHIVQSDMEARKYWVFRRESFNLLRSKLKDVRTVPFIEDVVVHSDDLVEFLPRFESILDQEKLVYTIAGHVGDGNIHVIPLMKLADKKSIIQLKTISEKVYALVQEYKGSLSGEHNDGLVRAPFLHYMYTEKMLKIFTDIKKAFDPQNIFNPNKKIDVTWDYAQKRIDRRK
jgi:FAD/FMN-containing dehydrogenase